MRLPVFGKSRKDPERPDESLILLEELGRQLQEVLEDNFVSLAASPESGQSDEIRFVCLTVRKLSSYNRMAVSRVHWNLLSSNPLAAKLSGDYLNLDDLRTRALGGPVLICEEGEAQLMPEYRVSLLDMYYLMEHGRVVVGKPIEVEIPGVDPADLDLHMEELVFGCTTPANTISEAAFRVLDCCQCLYVFQTRSSVSKRRAALWFVDRYGGEWTDLVTWAMDHHSGDQPSEEDDPGMLDGQVPFARYVLSLMEQGNEQAGDSGSSSSTAEPDA